MNKVILMGRLTRDPDVRYIQRNNSQEQTCIARYTLAVDRRFKRDGEQSADFIGCVAFGRDAEFAEKYFRQGTKIIITGRIQTGSYTNRDGQKVYTTDIVVEEQEFAESKKAAGQQDTQNTAYSENGDGFMNIPEGIDEELPFS
jgi:single-strand DNA-binding protein